METNEHWRQREFAKEAEGTNEHRQEQAGVREGSWKSTKELRQRKAGVRKRSWKAQPNTGKKRESSKEARKRYRTPAKAGVLVEKKI